MRYDIEYIESPRDALGLPACMKWNVYSIDDGDMYFHEEGFRLKREAIAYIKWMEENT